MSEEQRLDLSALDPRADTARWSAFLRETAGRVDAVMAERSTDPLTLIAGWMKSVTAATALVVAMLVPVEMVLERREAGQAQIDRLVQLSAEALRDGGIPTATELTQAVDGGVMP